MAPFIVERTNPEQEVTAIKEVKNENDSESD